MPRETIQDPTDPHRTIQVKWLRNDDPEHPGDPYVQIATTDGSVEGDASAHWITLDQDIITKLLRTLHKAHRQAWPQDEVRGAVAGAVSAVRAFANPRW